MEKRDEHLVYRVVAWFYTKPENTLCKLYAVDSANGTSIAFSIKEEDATLYRSNKHCLDISAIMKNLFPFANVAIEEGKEVVTTLVDIDSFR